MYPVLIGSRALKVWNPDMNLKDSTDWDVISYKNHEGCEIHNPDFLNNKEMCGYRTSVQVELPDGSKAFVMSMLGLAIIKRSHLWRDLSFDKHITMYHKFGLSAVLDEVLNHLTVKNIVSNDLYERTKLTKEAFPQGNPNLMQTKEDFFDDAVKKKFDHDYLHELVAFYDKPLYTRMLRTQELAWCEKDKWDCFTHEDKIRCIAEESFVIAIERFMIPSNWSYSSKLAYFKAVKKVCTTLCSGWFRNYAIDYFPEVISMYNQELFLKVKSILEKE